MPGYLIPSISVSNTVTPTNLIVSTTVTDAINELSRKSVNVFSSAASRSSAIPSPTQGMVSYLVSTKTLEAFDGSNWIDVGASSIPFLTVGT